jgi:ABC-2 type transport system permease protein
MSATAPPEVPISPVGTKPSGFPDVLRSEWIKASTLRSTFITLGITVLLTVGLGALISWAAGANYKRATGVFDPTSISLSGLALAQLAVAVLGTLAITGEYSTGMIRTSLVAVPRRGRVLAAKVIVYLAITVVVGEVISFLAFPIGQAILSGQHAPNAAFGQAHVLRAVIGAGLDLGLIALLGLAVGTLVRSTAGTIAILVGFLIVVPGILRAALPSSIEHPVIEWWPSEAGSQVLQVTRQAHTLSAWQGFGWFALFVAVLLAAAAVVLARRDA